MNTCEIMNLFATALCALCGTVETSVCGNGFFFFCRCVVIGLQYIKFEITSINNVATSNLAPNKLGKNKNGRFKPYLFHVFSSLSFGLPF